jgi:hypothetical protein
MNELKVFRIDYNGNDLRFKDYYPFEVAHDEREATRLCFMRVIKYNSEFSDEFFINDIDGNDQLFDIDGELIQDNGQNEILWEEGNIVAKEYEFDFNKLLGENDRPGYQSLLNKIYSKN